MTINRIDGQYKKTGQSSLQGYINAPLEHLESIFNKHGYDHDNFKTDGSWSLEFKENGSITIATIYNYKNGKNYLGNDGFDLDQIKSWNIGGFGVNAYNKVLEKLVEAFPNDPLYQYEKQVHPMEY